MIALDAFEQMHPAALRAGRRRRWSSPPSPAGPDRLRSQFSPNGRMVIPRNADIGPASISPSRATAECGMQFDGCCRRAACNCSAAAARPAGLLKSRHLERQCLIGPDHVPPCHSRRHQTAPFRCAKSFAISPGAQRPEFFCAARSSMSAGMASNGMPALAQQRLPRAASRGQDQPDLSTPGGHRGRIIPEAGCRCRSVNSFRTAAAVSSIERRVTSSCAQLNLALSRRANADFIGDRLAIDVIVIAGIGTQCSGAGSAEPGSGAPASHAG